MIRRFLLSGCTVAALVVLQPAAPVAAQSPHLRFHVSDTELPEAIAALGDGFENAWNALLVTEIEATLAGADSAVLLRDLEARVADAEPGARGTHIAANALALRREWSRAELRERLDAGQAEALANRARDRGDWRLADGLYQDALAGYGRLNERRRLAWVWGSMGAAAFNAGRFARAESLYKEALAVRVEIGDQRMIGSTCNALGSTCYQLERYADAYAWYHRARAARERTGQTAQLARTLNAMGLCATAIGRADSAVVWYERALAITVAGADSTMTAEVLANYAEVTHARNDLTGALALLDRAEAIASGARDPSREAQWLERSAEMLAERGRFGEAAAAFGRAAVRSEDAEDPAARARAFAGEGRAWLAVGDPTRARPPFTLALSLLDDVSEPILRVRVLDGLARASLMERDFSAATSNAVAAHDAAVALADSALERETALTLGSIASSAGDPGTARDWYERCAGAGTFGARARIEDLVNLALVASRTGRPGEAKRLAADALDLAVRSGDADLVWAARVGMGDAEEHAGNLPAALAHYRHAAWVVDTLHSLPVTTSRISAYPSRQIAFESLIHLLAKGDALYPDSGFVTEAFIWSERARLQGLKNLFVASGLPAPQLRPMTRDGAQALLERDDAMLVYSLGDSASAMWVLTQTDWDFLVLEPRHELRERVSALRGEFTNPSRAMAMSARRAARELYLAAVAPAERLIRDKDRLIVVPEGPLSLVPFEALLTEDPPDEKERVPDDAYLLDAFEISYAPSTTGLAAIRGRTVGGGIVALGDPLYASNGDSGPAGLDPLPNTAAELATLEQVSGKRSIEIMVGAEATRSRFLSSMTLADAQVVHIATHGVADDAIPARSGLYLAAEDGAPGFLSVADILRLDLRAALVTLSECQTGTGGVARGDGLLGLSRAFGAAGANSVIASHWMVDAPSTATLMRVFYEGVLKKERDRTRALAEAKRKLLSKKETRSPFYWAPFVLIGASGPLEE